VGASLDGILRQREPQQSEIHTMSEFYPMLMQAQASDNLQARDGSDFLAITSGGIWSRLHTGRFHAGHDKTASVDKYWEHPRVSIR